VRDVLSEPLTVRDDILFLWSFGVSVSVSRGHLVCVDGVADERRTIRIAKADRQFALEANIKAFMALPAVLSIGEAPKKRAIRARKTK
jgi:hypothetical protein